MGHNLHLRLVFLLVYWEQSSQRRAALLRKLLLLQRLPRKRRLWRDCIHFSGWRLLSVSRKCQSEWMKMELKRGRFYFSNYFNILLNIFWYKWMKLTVHDQLRRKRKIKSREAFCSRNLWNYSRVRHVQIWRILHLQPLLDDVTRVHPNVVKKRTECSANVWRKRNLLGF